MSFRNLFTSHFLPCSIEAFFGFFKVSRFQGKLKNKDVIPNLRFLLSQVVFPNQLIRETLRTKQLCNLACSGFYLSSVSTEFYCTF